MDENEADVAQDKIMKTFEHLVAEQNSLGNRVTILECENPLDMAKLIDVIDIYKKEKDALLATQDNEVAILTSIYIHLKDSIGKMGDAYMTLGGARIIMSSDEWKNAYLLRYENLYPLWACEEALEMTISYLEDVIQNEGDSQITEKHLCDYEEYVL